MFSLLTTHTPISKDFGNLAVDSAIYALSKSPNWIDTNVIVKLLVETENLRAFNNEQLEAVKAACCGNYEVYGGANSYPALKKLLETKYGIKGLV